MRTIEELLNILDEAIDEARTYGRELEDCTPGTTGYEIYTEIWRPRKRLFESVKDVIVGKADSLKAGCRLY